MKVFLISPRSGRKIKVFGYPYSLMYIDSYLRKYGYQSEIIDCDAREYDLKALVGYLKVNKAKFIGITSYSRYRFSAYETIRTIKKELPDCKIVAGGRHFSSLAVETLQKLPEVDFVVDNEGEVTLKELCDIGFNESRAGTVKGITYKDSGRIVNTGVREIFENLDELQYDYNNLPSGNFTWISASTRSSAKGVFSIMATRGCPGACTFCCLSTIRVRRRSMGNVLDEIEYKVKMTGSNQVTFSDSSFTANKEYLIEMCEGILKRNLNISWSCYSRVSIELELLKLMKKSGCFSVAIALESASPIVLKAIKKGIRIDQVMNFARACNLLKLDVFVYTMVSLPSETEEEAEKTFSLMEKLVPYIYKASCSITQIYPDTALYQKAKETGLLPDGFCWFKPYNCSNNFAGGKENIPYYIELLSEQYIRKYVSRYRKLYFRNFFDWKDSLSLGEIVRNRYKSFLFEWRNEGLNDKWARIKMGMSFVYFGIRNYFSLKRGKN